MCLGNDIIFVIRKTNRQRPTTYVLIFKDTFRHLYYWTIAQDEVNFYKFKYLNFLYDKNLKIFLKIIFNTNNI